MRCLHTLLPTVALIVALAEGTTTAATATEPASQPWLYATAYAIPKETTNQGSGYFSIIQGHNHKLYIGAAKYGVNAYLVEFDSAAEKMRIAVDCQKEIGTNATGFAAQAKIHSRNNVGPSGKIYFGTKQGYPEEKKGEKRSDYLGGYPMVYDPATGKTRVYDIPVPHQGIISVTPDESRGLAYISTCSDERPLESTHFMKLDLATGKYTDLLDCHHMYAFIVVDARGRAYHPIAGGDIARYDPNSERLERLKQTIDGEPPTPESRLAEPDSHPINWDITRDGKRLYAVAMSGNQLYEYDLTSDGDTLVGRKLGPLLPGAKSTDCRAMCVGPQGDVCAAVLGKSAEGEERLHLVTYRQGDSVATGDSAPRDRGPLAVRNPDYTQFVDESGKALPFHHGMKRLDDDETAPGVMVPLYHMGICQGHDGNVYVTAICPYTVLKITLGEER